MMLQKGFSFVEVLIGCLVSSLAIIGLYSLQIKTGQLLDKNAQCNAAANTANNQRELNLVSNNAA